MTAARWRMVLWALMLGAVLLVAWSARSALTPFLIGAILVYALSPVVDRVSRLVPARTHQQDVLRRGATVGLLYVLFFGALFGVGVAVVPTAVKQATEFLDDLPRFAADAQTQLTVWMDRFRAGLPPLMRENIDSAAQEAGQALTNGATDFLRSTASRLTGTIGVLAGIVVVPFWMFYALRDRHFVERNVMRAIPVSAQPDVRNIARISDFVLGRYIRAQLLLGLIVGLAVGVSMSLLGVQFAVGLGLWAGVTELIPILGPWLGAAAGIIVVLATEPHLVIPVAAVYLLVQVLENNLLVPRVQGRAMDIHPGIVIILLFVAGTLWGLLGMLVVVPLAGILRELFWYADRRLRGETQAEAYAHSHVGARQRDLPLDERLDDPSVRASAEQAAREAE